MSMATSSTLMDNKMKGYLVQVEENFLTHPSHVSIGDTFNASINNSCSEITFMSRNQISHLANKTKVGNHPQANPSNSSVR